MAKYLIPGQEQDILQSFRLVAQVSLEVQNAITTFLPGRKLELIYQASRDGWSNSDFHRLCDKQGSTVTVVTSGGGYVFGGYAEHSWTSRNSYVNDPYAFLFLVKSPGGRAPFKLALKQGQEEYALNDHSTHGPSFGKAHDLHVFTACGCTTGQGRPGHTYELPAGHTSFFFTGSPGFTLEEMEVYRVTSN